MKKWNDYLVTEDGQIYNKFGKPMSFGKVGNGNHYYYKLSSSMNGKKFDQTVHRIVWEAHNGEIPEGKVINHIDGNTFNNNISNLELTTQQQNVVKGNHPLLSRRLSTDDARFIKENYPMTTMQALADRFGVSREAVRSVLLGKTYKDVLK